MKLLCTCINRTLQNNSTQNCCCTQNEVKFHDDHAHDKDMSLCALMSLCTCRGLCSTGLLPTVQMAAAHSLICTQLACRHGTSPFIRNSM
jgi:hypothetical protein